MKRLILILVLCGLLGSYALAEGFSVGALNLTTLYTPGHTKGSSCYLVEQNGEKLLLSGDTLFARSIGRTDLTGGDEEAMTNSLYRLSSLEGDMPVLPGHGPETTLERERSSNPFLKLTRER